MDEQNPIAAIVGVSVLMGISIAINANSLFNRAHNDLIDIEGGYVYHKDDRGGETKWGITKATARKHGYTGPMKDLPKDVAAQIAYEGYWNEMGLDTLANKTDTTYQEIAFQLYKLGYHAGNKRAIRTFQRCLNVLNQQERIYPDIRQDGIMGPRTIYSYTSYRRKFGAEGVQPLKMCIDGLTVSFYVSISESRPQNQSFTRGWFKRLD